MAEEIIKSRVKEGDTLSVGYSKKQDKIQIKVVEGNNNKNKDSEQKDSGDENQSQESQQDRRLLN